MVAGCAGNGGAAFRRARIVVHARNLVETKQGDSAGVVHERSVDVLHLLPPQGEGLARSAASELRWRGFVLEHLGVLSIARHARMPQWGTVRQREGNGGGGIGRTLGRVGSAVTWEDA